MPAPSARRSAARLALALTLTGLVLPAPGCARMRAQHAPRSWMPSLVGRRASHELRDTLSHHDLQGLPPTATPTPLTDLSQNVAVPTEDPFAQRLAERHTTQQAPDRRIPQSPTANTAPVALAAMSESPAPSLTRTTAPPAGAVLAAAIPAETPVVAQAPPPPDLPPLDLSQAASTAPASTSTAPAPATPAPAPASAIDQLKDLVAASSRQIETFQSYQVMLTRQERVGTKLLPEETVLLSIRRQPRAVRLEWPEGENKGREVLFSADANGGGTMHIKMANALLPRLSLPADSPLALKNSRHPITEAGLEYVVTGLKATVDAHASGTAAAGDQLAYEGLVPPAPDLPPGHRIKRITPTGETWIVTLDANNHAPVLIEGTAANGDLLERYVFRNLQSDLPALASVDAFDPDSRWGASPGILGRLARGNANNDAASPPR